MNALISQENNVASRSRRGFTLVEIVTNLAIMVILAAILIPVFDRTREAARRSVDRSNIRQIGQAALAYADDHDDALPQTNLDEHTGLPHGSNGSTTVKAFAAALAIGGGLNDGAVWVSASDRAENIETFTGGPIMTDPPLRQMIVSKGFLGSLSALSYAVVAGLRADDRPTAPIAVSRGLASNGLWHPDNSVYRWNGNGQRRGEGGYIVFLGGNVQFFRDMGDSSAGKLVRWSDSGMDGSQTNNIFRTIPSGGERIFRSQPFSHGPHGNGSG